MNIRSLTVISVVLVSIMLAAIFHLITTPSPTEPFTATTTEVFHCDNDAKLCPDGSTVLREGAMCEFALCPSIYGEADDWRTGTNKDPELTFRYPVTLGTTYITPQAWPPIFKNARDASLCIDDDTGAGNATTTKAETFNGVAYCVKSQTEGAAGSLYTNYEIMFPKGDSALAAYFSLRQVQCANFEGSEQSACEATQNQFNVIELIDEIRAHIK